MPNAHLRSARLQEGNGHLEKVVEIAILVLMMKKTTADSKSKGMNIEYRRDLHGQ